jgi:hypothetical protein
MMICCFAVYAYTSLVMLLSIVCVCVCQIARDDTIYERLAKSVIAPEIWGREDIKKAVAAQLFSGVRQVCVCLCLCTYMCVYEILLCQMHAFFAGLC